MTVEPREWSVGLSRLCAEFSECSSALLLVNISTWKLPSISYATPIIHLAVTSVVNEMTSGFPPLGEDGPVII